MNDSEGLRDKLARQSEDALGKIAQDLLENSFVNGAISRAFEAREKAVQAQEAAMGALNLPSAADIERLTRRLRSVSQRLEGIEDGVDRLDQRLEALNRPALSGAEERLSGIESQLAKLSAELGSLASGLGSSPAHVPREQERLEVDASSGRPAAASRAKPKSKRAAARKKAAS
jgi:chromosome segregation ATPase